MYTTDIKLDGKYLDKHLMMESLAVQEYSFSNEARAHQDLLQNADPMILAKIAESVKNGGLSFEDSFVGMLLVLAATNNHIRLAIFPKMTFPEAISKGTGFLTIMAQKEFSYGLTPEEIAGMVGAATLDIIFRCPAFEVLETCGMGGDRGFGTKKVKTINVSTLSAIVLAAMGYEVFKHGSHGNTTKIGSVDIPVNFGAKICLHSKNAIVDLFEETGFWFSDAHSVKTIHYLSHLLMIETINHIIGPMTIPLAHGARLLKVMGVNHHVSPETIARAYTILHKKGFLNLGGVIVLAGVDTVPNEQQLQDGRWAQKHSFLDEVSPIATVASLATGENFVGNFLFTDDSFGCGVLAPEKLKIKNEEQDLMRANELAIRGEDEILTDYLARNAAIGLMLLKGNVNGEDINNLPAFYKECLQSIKSGDAFEKLLEYIEASGGSFRSWL
ncbi:MAG: hypothetical protein M1127_03515 [Patescibacteria group bacterium]|nr:hypothetical protein [Patescibacteria group bacterium]